MCSQTDTLFKAAFPGLRGLSKTQDSYPEFHRLIMRNKQEAPSGQTICIWMPQTMAKTKKGILTNFVSLDYQKTTLYDCSKPKKDVILGMCTSVRVAMVSLSGGSCGFWQTRAMSRSKSWRRLRLGGGSKRLLTWRASVAISGSCSRPAEIRGEDIHALWGKTYNAG